jgi:signal transduction histidine kinase
MTRPGALARIGAAAIIAAALAGALQQSNASTVTTMVAAAALTVAAAWVWLAPNASLLDAALLGPVGPLLVVATALDDPATPAALSSARAAALPVLGLVLASLATRRLSVAVALVAGLVAGTALLPLYDPFLDTNCANCGHAGAAVWADAGHAHLVWLSGMGLILSAALIELVGRRAAVVPAAVATVVLAVDPQRRWVLLVATGAAAAIWARRCWVVGRRQVAIRRMLAVHEGGGGLAAAMRRLMRDPTIDISFPTEDGTAFVDGKGVVVEPRRGRGDTDLVVHGDLLARVSHVEARPMPDLDLGLDAETVMRLHNERLNAQLAARVNDVTLERRRVVVVGLEERRSLERDLHDGVQQELLALGLDLRLALATTPAGSPDYLLLEDALARVHDCVDQVRAISMGVSPPMLETLGLRAAVVALRRRRGDPAGLVVDLDDLPARRLGDEIERAAFAVFADALARGATTMRAAVDDGALRVSASGITAGGQAGGVLPDLVAAVGGRLRSNATDLEAVIPCV